MVSDNANSGTAPGLEFETLWKNPINGPGPDKNKKIRQKSQERGSTLECIEVDSTGAVRPEAS